MAPWNCDPMQVGPGAGSAKRIVAQSGTGASAGDAERSTMDPWRSTDSVTSRCGFPTSICARPTTRRSSGLREVERDPTHVYLKGWDEHDHHSVILTEAARYGVEHIAFKTESVDDLEGYESVLERYGCTVERLAPEEERALGDAIRFDTPSGHIMEIYAGMEKVGNGLPMFNPPPMPIRPRRHRAAPARPLPADHRERARHGPLHAGGAAVPPHRADGQQRGAPAHRVLRALAPAPRRGLHPGGQRRAAPLRLLARQLVRRRAGPPTSCG